MGTLCHYLAFLLIFYPVTSEDTTTTQQSPQDDSSVTERSIATSSDLPAQFLTDHNDFINCRDNDEYFPLSKAYDVKLALISPDSDVALSKIVNVTETMIRGYRNYVRLPMNVSSITAEIGADFLPLHLTDVDVASVVGDVTKYPTNLEQLHRYGQAMKKSGSVSDKETFLEEVKVPLEVIPDIEFISAYRWNLLSVEEEYSIAAMSRLPVDYILNITSQTFEFQDLAVKLADKEGFNPPMHTLGAWFTLADSLIEETELKSKFKEYTKLLLAAPLMKMLEKMSELSAADKIKLLQDNQLTPVKVQGIWDTLNPKEDNIKDKTIADLFFSVGNKLDILQIDEFYKKTFSHLYSKRHEVEELWIHNDNVELTWPVIRYISKLHFPKVSTDQWGQKELIDMGAFGVGLTPDQLKKIPAAAFGGDPTTLDTFFSDRMSLGQLFAVFDKITENSGANYELPAALYPCLHSSLITGTESADNIKIGDDVEAMVKASLRFTPAQKIAYIGHLDTSLWNKDTLTIILKHNPSLLAEVGHKDFMDNLDMVLNIVGEATVGDFEVLVENLRKLPRRILHAWLTTARDDEGVLDIDAMLDVIPGDLDYRTRIQSSVKACSIALPGLSCKMIDEIPLDRLMEVLSTYRFSMPGEVIPSDARMCFVSAIRRYLSTKAVAFNVTLTSEIELLSLLSSSDIRAIGAELLLSWGGKVLANIPHPEVSYEVMLKISEENPHLFFHNGVDFEDMEILAKQSLAILKAKNKGNVDFSVLKKMRDLLPYLTDSLMVGATDIQNFFRFAYTSPLTKGICVPHGNRQNFRDLIVKGFGEPESWDSEVLAVLGDLLVTLDEADLYAIPPAALRKAVPTLVKESVYASVYLPEVKGKVEPQLYYKACNDWMTATDSENTFSPAWERYAKWLVSGSSLVTRYLSAPTQRVAFRKKREVESITVHQAVALYDKIQEIISDRNPDLSVAQRQKIGDILWQSEIILKNDLKKLSGKETNDIEKLISSINKSGVDLTDVLEKAKLRVVLSVISYLKLTAKDLAISEEYYEALIDRFTLGSRFIDGVGIVSNAVSSRSKRDTSELSYMELHDKVMQIFMDRFSDLTPIEQESAKEIIKESQELIGNGTLKLLGRDPTKLSLTQADILKIIEAAKAEGMTSEQEEGIRHIAADAQVRLVVELSNLLKLEAADFDITEDQFNDLKAIQTFQDTEAYISTAVYDFSMVTEVTGTGGGIEETTTSISELLGAEESLMHSIDEKIPKAKLKAVFHIISDLKLTADDLDISEDYFKALVDKFTLGSRYADGVGIVSNAVLSRSKRDTTELNYMDLHDKVMQILTDKFSDLTQIEQEVAKEIIKESQELIGNGTLKLLGRDPTKLSLTQADVLKIIEAAKVEGMTSEQEEGIRQIAADAQVRLVVELSNLLKLTATDFDITEDQFNDLKAIQTFQDTEAYISTAVYDFSTVTEVPGTGVTGEVEETTASIAEILEAEEVLVHSIVEEIPKFADIELTCDVVKTCGQAAVVLTGADVAKMPSQDVKDCLEDFGMLNYTPEQVDDVWPAIKEKLERTAADKFSEGDVVLLRNLLPAVAKQDLDLLDLSAGFIDGVSVLGSVTRDLSNDELKPIAMKYVDAKEGGDFTDAEVQSLGHLLCGLADHEWNRSFKFISKARLLKMLPQLLAINCVSNEEMKLNWKSKLPKDTVDLDIVNLSWLASILYAEDLDDVDYRELTGAAVRNLGSLETSSKESLSNLNPQAASLISLQWIEDLEDVDKMKAVAKSSGEDPRIRTALTAKLTDALGSAYPPPLPPPAREPRNAEPQDGGDNPGTRSSAVFILITFALVICISSSSLILL